MTAIYLFVKMEVCFVVRHLILNIKSTIKGQRLIMVLLCLSIITSSVIILVAYGVLKHTKELELESVSDDNTLLFKLVEMTPERITVGDMLSLCERVDAKMHADIQQYMIGAIMPDDEDIDIKNFYKMHSLYFSMENGHLRNVPKDSDIWDFHWSWGSYFRDEQFENGEMVCIGMEVNPAIDDLVETELGKKYLNIKDGIYTVGGKQYTCIGMLATSGIPTPMIPITTVDRDIMVDRFQIFFKKPVTRSNNNKIRDIFRELLGPEIRYPELDIPDSDVSKYNHLIILECMAFMLAACVMTAVLFHYILLQRKKNLTICRVYGMTLHKVKRLFLAECLVYNSVIFLAGIIIFCFVVFPILDRIYQYIAQYYTLSVYLELGLCYILISGIICWLTSGMVLRKNIKNSLRRDTP